MLKFTKKYAYQGVMDSEVIDLCNAINALPGLKTEGSCCGHGKGLFSIFFQVTSLHDGLFFLARCCDRRYFKHDWRIGVTVGDQMKKIPPTIFWLHSMTKGKKVYIEAKDLVINMNLHLNLKNFTDGYKLDISNFDLEKQEKAAARSLQKSTSEISSEISSEIHFRNIFKKKD